MLPLQGAWVPSLVRSHKPWGDIRKPPTLIIFFSISSCISNRLVIYRYINYLFVCVFIFGCMGSSLLARAFSSCGERGLLFIVVRGLLIAVASPVAEHRL